MHTLGLNLTSPFQPAQKDSLQYKLLRVACFVCAIDLPDTPKRSKTNTAMMRVALFFFVALSLRALFGIEDYLLPHINAPMQHFLNGFIHDTDQSQLPMTFTPSATRAFLFCLWFAVILWVISAVQAKAYRYTFENLALERERAARQEAESTLRLLKAQIEPHFLFNTLGAVQHLAEGKAPEAAELISDLIVFLRATMNSLRGDDTSIGDDLAICAAYLHIMEARLTRRLKFQIDCPAELTGIRIPTTLLLTLLENAIKHGIERAPDGGRIDIRVSRSGSQVEIAVADTGMGFAETVGQGVGLQNIRDRLALLYGARAALSLEENDPRGVIATLHIPTTPN